MSTAKTLVERLREAAGDPMKVDNFEVLAWLCSEAADEIDRLTAAKEQYFAQAMENGAKANAYRAALDEAVAAERERCAALVDPQPPAQQSDPEWLALESAARRVRGV